MKKLGLEEFPTWDELREELLADPKVAAEYEALRPGYEKISQEIEAGLKARNIGQE